MLVRMSWEQARGVLLSALGMCAVTCGLVQGCSESTPSPSSESPFDGSSEIPDTGVQIIDSGRIPVDSSTTNGKDAESTDAAVCEVAATSCQSCRCGERLGYRIRFDLSCVEKVGTVLHCHESLPEVPCQAQAGISCKVLALADGGSETFRVLSGAVGDTEPSSLSECAQAVEAQVVGMDYCN